MGTFKCWLEKSCHATIHCSHVVCQVSNATIMDMPVV
jgi:hypothetical protein